MLLGETELLEEPLDDELAILEELVEGLAVLPVLPVLPVPAVLPVLLPLELLVELELEMEEDEEVLVLVELLVLVARELEPVEGEEEFTVPPPGTRTHPRP